MSGRIGYTFFMGTLVLRDARPEDTPAMEELIVAAWQTAYTGVVDSAFVATRRTNEYAAKFRAMIEGGQFRVRVAEADHRVAGLATGALLGSGAYDCETKELYVHPEYQGRGIGSALLQDMMDHFRQGGCRSMIVWQWLLPRHGRNPSRRGRERVRREEVPYGRVRLQPMKSSTPRWRLSSTSWEPCCRSRSCSSSAPFFLPIPPSIECSTLG